MKRSRAINAIFTAVGLSAFVLNGVSAAFAQDLVPVSDLTGGSSVFVFRKTSAPRKFTTTVKRAPATKAQKAATAQRIRKQYETRSAAAPLRQRSAVVTPETLPKDYRLMGKQKASVLFAGVGEWYVDRGDIDNAIGVFREAVTLDSTNKKAKGGLADALAIKGNELLEKDAPDPAKALFLEALKNDPQNAAAYFGMGQISSDGGDEAQAIENYEKALQKDPGLSEIYQPLGILYYNSGQVAKADALLTKALAASPDDAETLVFLGSIRLSQDRDAEALTAFQKATSRDASNPMAWNGLGDALERQGKAQDAVDAYQKAIALKPNFFEAQMGLGAAYSDLKDYANAVKAYEKAWHSKNTSADALIALADAQRLAGNYDTAAGTYKLAADAMARDPKAFSKDDLADVQSKFAFVVGRQCAVNMARAVPCQWPVAISALEKAVQLSGGTAADYANLGWAYYNAARLDSAQKHPDLAKAKIELARVNLEKAVALKPSFIEGPLLNLGMARTDLGDYSGAADALNEVVKRQPKWAFAWNELGIAYRKQDKLPDAIDKYKKAVDIDSHFAAAYYNLGEAAIKAGKMDEARRAYKALQKLGATNFANSLDLMSKGAVRK